MSTLRPSLALLLAFGVLLLGVCGAFLVGRFPISPDLLVTTIRDAWNGAPQRDMAAAIIFNIRGPRILAAMIIGAALAMAGAAFQALFRNPLVSPDILGASSGAALGTVLGIYFSLGLLGIQFLAFAGGLGAVALVYAMASLLRTADKLLVLVLTGVIIGALIGAMIGLVKYLADPYNQLPAMTFWLLGSLSGFNRGDLTSLIVPCCVGAAILFALRWRMNAMSLSEEEAKALGIHTDLLRVLVVIGATLLTTSSVTVAGIIGWVGLIMPHIARFLTGPDFSCLLPVAAFLGASFMLLIDTLARSMAAVEIPLGILTALVGTPFFIWVLASARRTWS